jgi:50S ribosomal protein L16 3-hydroxylase
VRDVAKASGLPEDTVRTLFKRIARYGDAWPVAHDHYFTATAVADLARRVAGLNAAEGCARAAPPAWQRAIEGVVGAGQRRWRISAQKDLRLRDDVPLKILKTVKPTETLVLEAGDMLYLPPHYAHEGVAVGECMTYSIGFKAESPENLARELLIRVADMEADATSALYKDPRQPAAQHPAMIPLALQSFAQKAVQQALKRQSDVRCALGEFLSEPKSSVWFEPQPIPHQLGAVRLDDKSKMLYDKDFVFINGESWRCRGVDARALRQLADQRSLNAYQIANAPEQVRDLLLSWLQAGWLKATR